MDAATVAETLRQIIEGEDFSPPERMLKLSARRACFRPEYFPYSLATNVWHCDYWNRLWLARLTGEGKLPENIWAEDWQIPQESEWDETRTRFVANLHRAREIAQAIPFKHALKSDQDAIRRLHQIAVHTAYHIGQIALLKRMLAREFAKR